VIHKIYVHRLLVTERDWYKKQSNIIWPSHIIKIMKRQLLIFSVSFFITISLACGFLRLRTDESFPGVVSTELPGRCEIIQFGRGLQPVYKIVLACPRMDIIRVWPLLVQQPWFEDEFNIPLDDTLGEIDKRKNCGNLFI